MADTTHGFPGAYTAAELAALIGGQIEGDPQTVIAGVASIEDAQEGDVVFAESPRYAVQARKSAASLVVCAEGLDVEGKVLLRTPEPRVGFTRILGAFTPPRSARPGVHPSAVVGEGCTISPSASIGPLVSVGDGCVIGSDTVISAGTSVGSRCVIGDRCTLHANVTLYPGCVLENDVALHSGVVVGADGFGYMAIGDSLHKVPQVGIVRICTGVEVGANSTIDRAKTGETVIGPHTKIDNLVMVAHNVKMGAGCIIVAQVGIAGSTRLGNRVTLAGQAGLRDHITIGDGAMALGGAEVWGSVEAGAVVSGSPARPHREMLRQEAAIASLPDTVKRVKALEAQLAELRASLEAPRRGDEA